MVDKIDNILDKLHNLKIAVNSCSANLSLEDYDFLYSGVEELQGLVFELKEGK